MSALCGARRGNMSEADAREHDLKLMAELSEPVLQRVLQPDENSRDYWSKCVSGLLATRGARIHKHHLHHHAGKILSMSGGAWDTGYRSQNSL